MNFELNHIFLIKPFFRHDQKVMTKSQKQKAFNLKKEYFPSFLMKQLSWEG